MGMTRVVAAVDRSPVADLVRRTAQTLASALGSEVEEVSCEQVSPAQVSHDGASDRLGVADRDVDVVCAALAGEGVIAGVLGARRLRGRRQPLGHVAQAAITSADVPLVVVPPDAPPMRTTPMTFLAPLDGTPATERAVRRVVEEVVGALGDLIVLHVFDEDSVPMFVTSDEDRRILAEEWSHEHGVATSEPVVLRLGRPAETVLDVVRQVHPDALVLGWHRRLDDGHAEVVRRALAEAGVPVVLVPVENDADRAVERAEDQHDDQHADTEGGRR